VSLGEALNEQQLVDAGAARVDVLMLYS